MYVYFIQEGKGNHGYIKIGVSNNVNTRLDALQTCNPRKLTLMAAIKCNTKNDAYRLEKKLHKKFKAYNVRGEWFSAKIRLNSIQEDFEVEPDNYEKDKPDYIDRPSRTKKKSKSIKYNR